MTSMVITDVPASVQKRLGKTVSFSQIQGLYRDGMDWCQYDEVLPTTLDKKAIEKHLKIDKQDVGISFEELKKKLGDMK